MPVVTGIVNQMNSYVINAKPNPSDNNVVFAFSNDVNETANLTISTLEGKVVFNKSNITSKYIINIADLSAGVYLFQLGKQ